MIDIIYRWPNYDKVTGQINIIQRSIQVFHDNKIGKSTLRPRGFNKSNIGQFFSEGTRSDKFILNNFTPLRIWFLLIFNIITNDIHNI